MKKIIIAETVMRELGTSSSLFKRSSITFFVAHSSEEMLNLHGVNKADLIIADDSLPLMGGAKLCSLIRGDNNLKGVSIILICDNAGAQSPCSRAGANALIARPMERGDLLWKVSELLVVPQRKDIRAQLRVVIKGMGGDTPFLAETCNISISGLQIETERVLHEGDQLACTFNVAHNEVTVLCTIRRIEASATGIIRYGVEFNNCDTKSLIIIEQYVKAQIRQ